MVSPKANLWWLLASLVLVFVLGLDFGVFLVFVFVFFHAKENRLFLLSLTCVETSEWSEEQNRDCYPLYKSHLDAGSKLKIKMSMTLTLFFLPWG